MLFYGKKSYLTELDLTQRNPSHGSTQPMAMSGPPAKPLVRELSESIVKYRQQIFAVK